MEKKRVAVVGYGNIGKFTVEAIEASCDMEIAGIVRRNVNDIPEEIKKYKTRRCRMNSKKEGTKP